MFSLFLVSVVLGYLIFLLTIIVSAIELSGLISLGEYYNTLAVLITNIVGLYFLILYTMEFSAHRDTKMMEQLARDQILQETRKQPHENYSIKLIV